MLPTYGESGVPSVAFGRKEFVGSLGKLPGHHVGEHPRGDFGELAHLIFRERDSEDQGEPFSGRGCGEGDAHGHLPFAFAAVFDYGRAILVVMPVEVVYPLVEAIEACLHLVGHPRWSLGFGLSFSLRL